MTSHFSVPAVYPVLATFAWTVSHNSGFIGRVRVMNTKVENRQIFDMCAELSPYGAPSKGSTVLHPTFSTSRQRGEKIPTDYGRLFTRPTSWVVESKTCDVLVCICVLTKLRTVSH